MQLPMVCSALFSSIFPEKKAQGDWGCAALLWQQTLITALIYPALALSHFFIQCHIPTLAAVLQREVIGQYLLIPYVTRWPASSLTVLYVWMSKPLPFSSRFLCLNFWLNHQITVCLPSQVTVSAVSGWHTAWSFPKVFFNFCLVHLETNIREYIKCTTAPAERGFSSLSFIHFPKNMSWG